MAKKTEKKTGYKKNTKVSPKIKDYVDKKISANIETKQYYFDSGTTSIPYDKTGQMIPLSQVTQGVGDFQRIGDIIHPTKISVRLQMGISTVAPDVARVILFIWRPAYSPAIDDVLYYASGVDYQSAMSAYNDSKRGEFQILYDKLVMLTATDNLFVKQITKKLNIKQEYVGSTTVSTRQIYMILLSEGTPAGRYVFNSVMYYKDG